MGTEVLRPHDCLARARRPLRHGPAGRRAAAAHHGHGHGARGDARGGHAATAATAPRQVRMTKVVVDAYAGTAFGAMSPSPRALPLPRFTSRASSDDGAAATAPGVDDAATRELRRLLGLH
ncbi:hypothetical protein HU200_008169 [Digitaria exilis]|uniref:Uncharacterized protein n=1 Tax=Digitaria exilis TaxID=1010633 RepID=A0A835FLR6_9POAL|nr:hypothetical protein HU200_008169 [Digitaria exilis]